MELPVSEAIFVLVLLATNGLLLAASEEYIHKRRAGGESSKMPRIESQQHMNLVRTTTAKRFVSFTMFHFQFSFLVSILFPFPVIFHMPP